MGLFDTIRSVIQPGEPFTKADQNPGNQGNLGPEAVPPPQGDPKALVWDPYSIIEQLGYKDKPSQITYQTLDLMVWQMPVIQALIQTRLNQVYTFCQPQHNIFKPGFKIRPKDQDYTLTPADKKFIKKMENMMMNTSSGAPSHRRDNFKSFVRKFTRDSMVYDQGCFEIVKNRKGQPAAFFAVDAATIRLADTASTTYTEEGAIRTVPIYDNMVVNEWKDDEMAFCVRNPRTSIRSYGYGTSELEMLIKTITSLLWAWDYNQNFFHQGTVAKGLLNIKGTMNRKQLDGFKRHWYQMVSGVENSFRSPVLSTDKEGGVEWINMQNSNRDMEFSHWVDFLIKVSAAIYQMDPIEINFRYGPQGAKTTFESGGRSKQKQSKDKGLRPLLDYISQSLTDYIVRPIDKDFVFEFVGLEAQTQENLAQINQMRVKSSHTPNEIRTEQNLDPLDDGDIVLDPVYVQYKLQKEQMEQQAAMGLDPNGNPVVGGSENQQEGAQPQVDQELKKLNAELDKMEGGKDEDVAKSEVVMEWDI